MKHDDTGPQDHVTFHATSWDQGYVRGYMEGYRAGELTGAEALRERLEDRLALLACDLRLGLVPGADDREALLEEVALLLAAEEQT